MPSSSKPEIRIEPCTDVDLLCRLYRELAEDERSDNVRTDEEIREGMEELLKSEKAFSFREDDTLAGYALVNMARKPPYLHHFYICRDMRRQGTGTAAFRLLLKTLGAREMDLDVFVWNERGNAFWKSLGFTPRATIMRYKE